MSTGAKSKQFLLCITGVTILASKSLKTFWQGQALAGAMTFEKLPMSFPGYEVQVFIFNLSLVPFMLQYCPMSLATTCGTEVPYSLKL